MPGSIAETLAGNWIAPVGRHFLIVIVTGIGLAWLFVPTRFHCDMTEMLTRRRIRRPQDRSPNIAFCRGGANRRRLDASDGRDPRVQVNARRGAFWACDIMNSRKAGAAPNSVAGPGMHLTVPV